MKSGMIGFAVCVLACAIPGLDAQAQDSERKTEQKRMNIELEDVYEKDVPLTKYKKACEAKDIEEWEEWAKAYGTYWEKWGKEFEKNIALKAKDIEEWEEWAEAYGKYWEKWGKEFEKDIALKANKLSRELTERLRHTLNDELLKNLEPLKALDALNHLEKFDRDALIDTITDALEKSFKGVEAMKRSEKDLRKDMERMSGEIYKASDRLRAVLESRRHEWDETLAEQMKALGESFGNLDARENYEKALELYDQARLELLLKSEAVEKARSREYLKSGKKDRKRLEAIREADRKRIEAVRKQRIREDSREMHLNSIYRRQDAIKAKDRELKALKEEIEALKRELRTIKEEKERFFIP